MPATVLIDGGQAGETPLTDHPLALGTRDIVVRSAAGEERKYTRTSDRVAGSDRRGFLAAVTRVLEVLKGSKGSKGS